MTERNYEPKNMEALHPKQVDQDKDVVKAIHDVANDGNDTGDEVKSEHDVKKEESSILLPKLQNINKDILANKHVFQHIKDFDFDKMDYDSKWVIGEEGGRIHPRIYKQDQGDQFERNYAFRYLDWEGIPRVDIREFLGGELVPKPRKKRRNVWKSVYVSLLSDFRCCFCFVCLFVFLNDLI